MDEVSTLLNYDFQTKQGISAILKAIRESDLSISEKAELRDLIFHYTSGGYDESTKIELEKRLQTAKIKISETIAVEKEVPVVNSRILDFGTMRPEPVFNKISLETQKKLEDFHNEKPAEIKISTEVVSIVQSVQKQEEKTSEEVKEIILPKVVEEIKKVEIDVKEKNPISQNTEVAVKEESILEIKKEDPVETVLAGVGIDNLERIKQIKTEINNKIGNPVNLVDINNQVGREYMSALLDAMKKINASTPRDISIAMERLEKSYQDVSKIISDLPNNNTKTETPIIEEKKENLSKESLVIENNVIPEADFGIKFESPKEEELNPIPRSPLPINDLSLKNSLPPVSKFTPSVDNIAKTEQTSLVDEKRPTSFTDIPKVLPTNSETPSDPLFNTEIDRGLEQLLSDWSLFKKSGLFGTGPKGREHPLFKKISGLQIPLLLAGRFEGANQEIRQSITDYMNGWRYEQGIIYEQGETFEIYLRRVIKHIIDVQRRRITT